MTNTTAQNITLTMPGLLLRAEGLAIFVGAIALYAALGGNGWLFIALLLVPDVAMLGYLRNPQLGALTYNAAHNLVLPLALFGVAMAAGWTLVAPLAVIWLAHIGMDRTVGYGLKYATFFKDTHMNRV